jgi:hypothetical protein
MFTVFIDDSGTDPNQAVAIASAIIIPSERLLALEEEWNRFKGKRGFNRFHTSACVYRNVAEGFGNWSIAQIERTVGGVRFLIKRYGAQIISFAVKKDWKPRSLGHLERALRHLRMEKSGTSFRISRRTEFSIVPFGFEFSRIRPKRYRKFVCSLEVVDFTDSMAVLGVCCEPLSGLVLPANREKYRENINLPDVSGQLWALGI